MLLGRERECAAIESTVTSVRSGEGRGLVVRGEAGIGKSALLDFAAAVADDVTVLRACGVESETQLSWAGLHALLWPHVGRIPHLPPPQAQALSSALGLDDAVGSGPFLVSAAVVTLLGQLAEDRPVLLLVDDVQWMDRESVECLGFALRRLESDRVGILFARREPAIGVFDLRAPGDRVVDLELSPLDDAAVERFLDSRVPLSLDHRIRRRIAEAARGNPLALTELSAENAISEVEGGAEPLANRLEASFLKRAHALPPAVQELLVVASADDSLAVDDLLDAATRLGIDGHHLLTAERSGLLTVQGTTVSFAHPLVRSAIYRNAPGELRTRAHQALAQTTAGREPARSTWHLAAAVQGTDESVARALAEVAAQAGRRAALATAARAYRRAAELTGDVALQVDHLTSAAESSWQTGDSLEAQQLVDAARRLPRSPQQVARVEHLRGRLQVNTGIVQEGFEILYAAAAQAAEQLPEKASEILADAYRAASYEGLEAQVREAGTLARQLHASSPTSPHAAYVAGVAALWSGEPHEAAPLLGQVVEGARAGNDATRLVLAAKAALYGGDAAGGFTYGTRAAVLAREQGALGTLASAMEMVAFADLHTSLDRTELSAHEGLQAARETHQTPSVALHLSTLATVAAYRGDEQACLDTADQVFELARRHGLGLPRGMAAAALGLLDLGLGRPQLAADRLEGLLATTTHPMIRLSAASDLVEAAWRAGDAQRARGAVALMDRWAASNGSVAAQAAALRCHAVVDRTHQSVRTLETSLELVRGPGWPVDLARTHLLLGEHLRRARQRSEARPHLRTAWETFDRLGARPWAERARTELRATGESARSRRSSGTESLTPQERHIAALVAGGATSKQVAAQLFLSPRTVDYHLRKVFTKTGISSRTELRTLDLET